MEPIRAGLIGTGFGGHVALPGLRSVPGVDVVAVCSADLGRATAFAKEVGIPEATDDAYNLVARDDIDLVLVCTPPMLHVPMSEAALAAGKHVFQTKPLAPSAAEARRLRDSAREHGVVTAMDLDNRYVPVRRYLRQLVADGYIGTPRIVASTLFMRYTTQPDNRIYYWNWVSLRDQVGGMLGASLGLHHIDQIRYLFGEVTDVGGVAATTVTEKPVMAPGHGEWTGLGPDTPTIGMKPCDAEDAVAIHGRLVAGGVFTMTASWSTHHGNGSEIQAYGSDGTLSLHQDGTLYGARAGEPDLQPLKVPESFGPASLANDHVGRFKLLFADVAASIRGEAVDPAFATFEDGLRAREIAEIVIGGR